MVSIVQPLTEVDENPNQRWLSELSEISNCGRDVPPRSPAVYAPSPYVSVCLRETLVFRVKRGLQILFCFFSVYSIDRF